MAKTNWQLNDTVLPADMNQIGTEINTNTDDITLLKGRTTTAEGKITTLEGNYTTLNGKVTTAEGNITTLQSTKANLASPAFTGTPNFTSAFDMLNASSNNKLRFQNNANGFSYIQIYAKDTNTFVANSIIFFATGAVTLTEPKAAYLNAATGQMRNIFQGNSAPAASLGAVGDVYIEW